MVAEPVQWTQEEAERMLDEFDGVGLMFGRIRAIRNGWTEHKTPLLDRIEAVRRLRCEDEPWYLTTIPVTTGISVTICSYCGEFHTEQDWSREWEVASDYPIGLN